MYSPTYRLFWSILIALVSMCILVRAYVGVRVLLVVNHGWVVRCDVVLKGWPFVVLHCEVFVYDSVCERNSPEKVKCMVYHRRLKKCDQSLE